MFFTILLLTGNTMAQSIRERIPELAILKTLGFSDGKVTALVLAEALLLLLARRRRSAWRRRPALLPVAQRRDRRPLPAALRERRAPGSSPPGIAVAVALAIGLPPALRARRLRIVDALAGHR